MPIPPSSTAALAAAVANLAHTLTTRQQMLVTAESCTGGLIAASCTDLAGSSQWFERGLVTYSNAAKTELLGVDPHTIDTHGAVSEPVARAMVQGALQHSRASVGVSVTGIAGPSGGSASKPVGLVWFGWALADGAVDAQSQVFPGNRAAVRHAACLYAIHGLLKRLQP